MDRTRFPRLIASLFAAALLLPAAPRTGSADDAPGAAAVGEAPGPKERADALVEVGQGHWDRKEFDRAVAKYQEALAVFPAAGTYKELGDLYREQDRHAEAIAAYRAAIAADSSLEPALRFSIGEQLLWSDRAGEALPLIRSVAEARPHDIEAQKALGLAYRWTDRLKEAEEVYRRLLAANPRDREAREGLAETLLWQGRFRAATDEFRRVLETNPNDNEALVALSRARLFLDLPEEAAVYADRAVAAAPGNRDALDQVRRIRERTARHAAFEARGSNDSDELTIFDLSLALRARPARGVDLEAAGRQLFFRQGSPGKTANIDGEDSVDGSGGSLALSYRASPALAFRAGAGAMRYDVAGFSPWTGHAGVAVEPADTVRFSLDWERSHFDSILSLQNKVTADTLSLTAAKHFLWKTEISGEAAAIRHRNENTTGQDRSNRGQRFGLALSRRLYLNGDIARVTGTVRLGWLGFDRSLDVGVFDPERYTTEEAGIDWLWRIRPLWEFTGSAFGGAQQEKGQKSGPMYSAELNLDRKIGLGRIGIGGFADDSNARGQGEGFRRFGGLLRAQVPF